MPIISTHHGYRAGAWNALVALIVVILLCHLNLAKAQSQQGSIDIKNFSLQQTEEGVFLQFNFLVQLPSVAEDAIKRGVPLYFVALADVYRSRWYWFDQRIGGAKKTWRLSYQPLTGQYRVSLGGLAQSFSQLNAALATISQAAQWQVCDSNQIIPSEKHHIEFSWKLDTSQLPSPLQLGIANATSEWSIGLERKLPLN